MNVKLSFVIATYNRVHLLPRALDSVFDQSDPEIEVIVVDDCSTDSSLELLRSTYPLVTVLKTPQNGGPAVARNLGFDHASGEFVGIFDSDNALLPGSLKTIKDTIFPRKDSTDLFYFASASPSPGKHCCRSSLGTGEMRFEDILADRITGEHLPVISRRVLQMGYRFEPTRAGAEGLFWLQILQKYPGYVCNKPVQLYYTDHTDRDFHLRIKRAQVYAEIHDRFRSQFGKEMLRLVGRTSYMHSASKSGWYWMLSGNSSLARDRFFEAFQYGIGFDSLAGFILSFGPRKIPELIFRAYVRHQEG